ncbi:hypothetical protein L1887_38354 [Cichorium endivia]|nr:hypothetical protein L1887_38354 [Cichorium endivia]
MNIISCKLSKTKSDHLKMRIEIYLILNPPHLLQNFTSFHTLKDLLASCCAFPSVLIITLSVFIVVPLTSVPFNSSILFHSVSSRVIWKTYRALAVKKSEESLP